MRHKFSNSQIATFSKLAFLILGILTISLTIKQEPITVYIIGDSTAANKTEKAYPETGWGMELDKYFNQSVKIDNHALNGRSTKSFITEKHWDKVLATLKKGDYLLIEFGHNDEKVDKPEVGTTLDEYQINLIKYIREAKEKHAIPILLTPIARRSFKDGVFRDSHGAYPSIVRKLADSLAIPLIDMHQKTGKLISELGEERSIKLFNYVDSGHANYPAGKKDNTHLSPYGAKIVAGMVADGIKETNTKLAKFIIGH